MASNLKMTELQSDIAEMIELQKQAKRKSVIDCLSLNIRNMECQLKKLQEDHINAAQEVTQSTAPKRYEIKLNGYGWDQSKKFVKVFVTLKNVHTLPGENVHCDTTENSMELHVKNLDNKDYVLVINNLLKPINTAACHWKQKTDMVVVFLAKVDESVTWSHMTEIEKRFEENKANKFKPDTASPSDPQDSLMGLMRNMYESGDDDMKRMIKKAWTEGQEKNATKSTEIGF